MVKRSVAPLVGCLVGRSVGRSVGRLNGCWLVVGWLVGWLVGPLVGRSVGRLNELTFISKPGECSRPFCAVAVSMLRLSSCHCAAVLGSDQVMTANNNSKSTASTLCYPRLNVSFCVEVIVKPMDSLRCS